MINKKTIVKKRNILFLLIISFLLFIISSCIGMAATAEEYFSIGMAYYDLGKMEDAEKWLNRARQADRTYVASQYNLGRIAFERKRYDEAAKQFEGVLRRDPDNVLALRAAAYTRIQMGDIEIANKHYSRLLRLVPESHDDGYNHALVLFAMENYSEAELVLEKYPFALRENKDMQLLYARSQGRQNKVEAIDNFANWLKEHSDNKARYEYALVLEHHEFYARALEEFRKTLEDLPDTSVDPHKYEVRFSIARVLLVAERDSNSGVTEMQGAVNDGFSDIAAIEKIIAGGKLSNANVTALRTIVDNLRREAAAEQQRLEQQRREQQQEEEDSEDDSETDS